MGTKARYLGDGVSTGIRVHSVRSLGTVEGIETFEVLSHGGPYNYPMVDKRWEVTAGPGWLHITHDGPETVQAFDGIRSRIRPGHVYIGKRDGHGVLKDIHTRAYSLYPKRDCAGETGDKDDRCGRIYGHCGSCDWCE